jgi:hypothetical protein
MRTVKKTSAKKYQAGGAKPKGVRGPSDSIIVKKSGKTMGEMARGAGEPVSYSSSKTKTVSVSPDKKYKTKVKQKMGPSVKGRPSSVSTKVKNRRTVKGVASGAPKAGMMKKGGAKKK